MTVQSRTWIQLQHRLRSTHGPLRSHQHTIIKQRIERSTCEDRGRGFDLRHVREERRDIWVASVFLTLAREVCGDVTKAVSVRLLQNGGEAYELVHDFLGQYQRLIEVVHMREESSKIEGAEVQHEAFEGERRFGFQQAEASHGAEMAAGRVPSHEPQRRAVFLLSVVYQPVRHVFAIVVAFGVWVFRGKAVADADDGELAVLRDPIEHQVLVVFGLKDPAAAVDVVEHRFWVAGVWCEDAAGNFPSSIARG